MAAAIQADEYSAKVALYHNVLFYLSYKVNYYLFKYNNVVAIYKHISIVSH